jgi:hypothetical protein
MARTYPDATALRLVDLCALHLRPPIGSATDDETGDPLLDFDPPLDAQEQTTYDSLLALARSGMEHLTPDEYATIRPQLVIIRDLRQMGRNAFMALTAAERDRLLYDAQAATTTILLALLRE